MMAFWFSCHEVVAQPEVNRNATQTRDKMKRVFMATSSGLDGRLSPFKDGNGVFAGFDVHLISFLMPASASTSAWDRRIRSAVTRMARSLAPIPFASDMPVREWIFISAAVAG
jgi:hypothetical protein